MYSEPVRAAYSSYENYALAVLGYSMLRCGVFRMGDFSGDGDHRGFTLRVDADGACTIADSVGVSAVLAGDNKVVTDVGCDIPSISKSVSVHERASRGSTSSIDRVDDGSIGVNDVMGVCHNIPVARDVPGAFGKQTFVGVKGANYERNCVNREKRKNRKIKRQAIQGKNWRRGTDQGHDTVAPALNCGSTLPVKDSGINGFWNSCSEDMRRQLIESKARMHVASNNKKAEEDERRVKQLQSPEQILRDAMRLVNFANDQAKAKNDSKVSGWAKTVAESYAETIAKSAPTSVESFESFVQSNSSITSVSIEAFNEVVKIKDEQLKVLDTQSKTLDTQSRTLDELNKRIAELEVIARSRGNITAKCGVLGKYGEKKPIGNVVTGVSNVKIAQRNTQVAGTIVADNRSARQDFIANSERTVLETAKPERIMSQEHFLKFGKQPGVFFDGKDVFC